MRLPNVVPVIGLLTCWAASAMGAATQHTANLPDSAASNYAGCKTYSSSLTEQPYLVQPPATRHESARSLPATGVYPGVGIRRIVGFPQRAYSMRVA